MTAGILGEAGYFMGDHMLPARDGNPKGFFEDATINRINEDILRQVAQVRPGPEWFSRIFFRHIPTDGLRWLSQIPVDQEMPEADEELRNRITHFTEQKPYCFKDPRFSYTLQTWRPFLNDDTGFICVFRDPSTTARSVLKDREKAAVHYGDLRITYDDAIRVWNCVYEYILARVKRPESWLFLHYDQILYEDGIQRIASFTGADVNPDFPETRLRRTKPEGDISDDVQRIYDELCMRANYAPSMASAV